MQGSTIALWMCPQQQAKQAGVHKECVILVRPLFDGPSACLGGAGLSCAGALVFQMQRLGSGTGRGRDTAAHASCAHLCLHVSEQLHGAEGARPQRLDVLPLRAQVEQGGGRGSCGHRGRRPGARHLKALPACNLAASRASPLVCRANAAGWRQRRHGSTRCVVACWTVRLWPCALARCVQSLGPGVQNEPGAPVVRTTSATLRAAIRATAAELPVPASLRPPPAPPRPPAPAPGAAHHAAVALGRHPLYVRAAPSVRPQPRDGVTAPPRATNAGVRRKDRATGERNGCARLYGGGLTPCVVPREGKLRLQLLPTHLAALQTLTPGLSLRDLGSGCGHASVAVLPRVSHPLRIRQLCGALAGLSTSARRRLRARWSAGRHSVTRLLF
jgi:hypothetical protein